MRIEIELTKEVCGDYGEHGEDGCIYLCGHRVQAYRLEDASTADSPGYYSINIGRTIITGRLEFVYDLVKLIKEKFSKKVYLALESY